MMTARENKARAGATLEGLKNRKKDLLSNIKEASYLNETNTIVDNWLLKHVN